MSTMVEEIKASAKGMQTVGHSKDHQIIIDEPSSMGGRDEGANPLGTLLVSLAGCENVIANMVAKEINFDLQGIEFEVKGELDPNGMMGKEGVRPYFQKIFVNAKVSTSESDERIQELQKIERIQELQKIVDSRCPIYTSLEAADIEMVPSWTKA
ncbi:OsmC family peroxiredoxin [Filobacillus milosensis]|uniref:OsmC family peroxiredoxin n=1 Tax=Filobacillus milosensis TaxID=94137 RepID=A0A4Y8ITM8_9BACI|nr:OsmC family protein [Filobacillus milosensis]TFB24061.1 OsmC family peroxiredoxin [Filobacillus milosensis]